MLLNQVDLPAQNYIGNPPTPKFWMPKSYYMVNQYYCLLQVIKPSPLGRKKSSRSTFDIFLVEIQDKYIYKPSFDRSYLWIIISFPHTCHWQVESNLPNESMCLHEENQYMCNGISGSKFRWKVFNLSVFQIKIPVKCYVSGEN